MLFFNSLDARKANSFFGYNQALQPRAGPNRENRENLENHQKSQKISSDSEDSDYNPYPQIFDRDKMSDEEKFEQIINESD